MRIVYYGEDEGNMRWALVWWNGRCEVTLASGYGWPPEEIRGGK